MNLYSAIFPISTVAWWFMTAYIMVLLISPFIENGIKLIAKKEFICVLVFYDSYRGSFYTGEEKFWI